MQLTIEKKPITKITAVTAALVAVALTTSCCGNSGTDKPLPTQVSYSNRLEVSTVELYSAEEPVLVFDGGDEPSTEERELPEDEEILIIRYSMEDVEAMALTLAGECYDDKPEDKRLVCEVILNRVSDGRFGDTPYEVCSAPYQFSGYEYQSRSVTENDYEVVYQALKDWHDNEYQALSEWLYFSAGDNHENVFRKEY